MRNLATYFFMPVMMLSSVNSFGTPTLEKRIRTGEARAVVAGYKQYLTSINATYRQTLREALQSSLDVAPATLLNIEGIHVEPFCDGEDIDQASGANAVLMKERAAVRVKKIRAAKAGSEARDRCVAGLERFIECTEGLC